MLRFENRRSARGAIRSSGSQVLDSHTEAVHSLL